MNPGWHSTLTISGYLTFTLALTVSLLGVRKQIWLQQQLMVLGRDPWLAFFMVALYSCRILYLLVKSAGWHILWPRGTWQIFWPF